MEAANVKYYPWPLSGWGPECEQQDFHQGAEELNFPHLSSTPPTSAICSEHLQDWDIRDSLGCGELEAFSEVILPDSYNFGPEDLFEGLPEPQESWIEASPFRNDEETYSDAFAFDSTSVLAKPPNAISEEGYPPPITIKLKRVSLSKTRNNYSVCDMEPTSSRRPDTKTFTTTTSSSSSPANFQPYLMGPVFDNDASAANDNATDSFVSLQSEDLFNTPVTLKEALDMEDADFILESYLSPGSSSSASESSDTYASEATSPFGQVPSPPEDPVVMSPCNSITSNDSEGLRFPQSPLGASQSEETVSKAGGPCRRERKTRSKLSAESRYLRKKEQNKQAALRYRAKKKQEDEKLLDSLQEEERKKEDWEQKNRTLTQEITFMKKLMLETLVARKLVPSA